MKTSVKIMLAILGIVSIACGSEGDVAPLEDIVSSTDSSDECVSILSGKTSSEYHLYVLNGVYDDCGQYESTEINFVSFGTTVGANIPQESNHWTSFDSVDQIDSLTFNFQAEKYLFVSDRVNMGNATIIYLSNNEDGSFGFEVNYLDVSECESAYLTSVDGQIRLNQTGECD